MCVYITYRNRELNINVSSARRRWKQPPERALRLLIKLGVFEWLCVDLRLFYFWKNNCSVCLKVIVTNLKKNIPIRSKIKELRFCILNMQKENCRNGRAVKKRQRRSVCVYLYNSVLFRLFMACDLVHELLCSVAAEKQRCCFMNSPFNKYDAEDYHTLLSLFFFNVICKSRINHYNVSNLCSSQPRREAGEIKQL